MTFIIGWAILFSAVLIWEYFSIVRKERGDTLSEQVWKLMKYWPAAMLIMGLWFWLTWHWFIEPQWFESLQHYTWWDDYVVTGLGMLSAVWFTQRD